MQRSFQPTPGAAQTTLDIYGAECLAVKLNVFDFVNGMVGIDDVYFDFAANRIYVSFYAPCSEDAICRRLIGAGYGVEKAEPPTLVLQENEIATAIPA